MNNKVKYIVFALSIVLISLFSINSVEATSDYKLKCTYEGKLVADGDGSDTKMEITIYIDKDGNLKWDEPLIKDDFITAQKYYELNSANIKLSLSGVYTFKVSGKYYKEISSSDSEFTNIFVKEGKYTCPRQFTMLEDEYDATAPTVEYTFIFTTSVFSSGYCDEYQKLKDFPCYNSEEYSLNTNKSDEGKAYDGTTINNSSTSSGSCCVYETGYSKIYFYNYNNASGAKSYAICFGNNCMTKDPTNSNVAQPADKSWSSYQVLSNCNNMPSNLYWAKVDGKYVFYAANNDGSRPSDAPSSAMPATKSTTATCKSTVYDSYSTENNQTNKSDDATNDDDSYYNGDEYEDGCPKIILPAIKFIRRILKPIVQIGVPILLILMGTIDFAKAVMASDDKAIKEATSKFAKRCIAAVVIFFAVTIVNIIMGMFTDTDLGKQADWSRCWDAADPDND